MSEHPENYLCHSCHSFCVRRKTGPCLAVSSGISSERCVESGKQQGETTWGLTVVGNHHESWDNGRKEWAHTPELVSPGRNRNLRERTSPRALAPRAGGEVWRMPDDRGLAARPKSPLRVGRTELSRLLSVSKLLLSCPCFPPDGTTEQLAGRGGHGA